MAPVNGGLPSGKGFVRSVFSGKAQAQAIPLDLLLVVVKIAERVALRRRLASEFSGYLASDDLPGVVPLFSARREWHQFGFNAYAATSCRWPLGLRGDFPHSCSGRGVVAGGPLDAPEEMAAGSVVSCRGEPHGRLTLRGEDCARLAGRLDRQGGAL